METEYGKCDICGKEAKLERTYFTYPIICECHNPRYFEKDVIVNKNPHFVLVRHCENCVPSLPTEIYAVFKAMDGKNYRAKITNILPISISGEFKITDAVIKEE